MSGLANLSVPPVADSTNSTNVSASSPDAVGFIAIGVAHIILVVLPSLALGSTILYLIASNKTLHNPVTMLFACVTVLCMVAPSTCGLLMDVSLISGVPVFGRCETLSGAVTYWTLQPFFHYTLSWIITSMSITQFAMVKGGHTLVTTPRVVLSVVALVIPAALLSLANVPVGVIDAGETEEVYSSRCIPGSSSMVVRMYINIFSALVAIVLPTFLAFGFTTALYCIVRKHALDSNRTIVHSVQRVVMAVTLLILTFRVVPILPAVPGLQRGRRSPWRWAVLYSVDLNYPLTLLFILTLHKNYRVALSASVNGCFKPSNQVAPSV